MRNKVLKIEAVGTQAKRVRTYGRPMRTDLSARRTPLRQIRKQHGQYARKIAEIEQEGTGAA